MDPLLRSKFEDFLQDFESYSQDDIDREYGREKFLMLMHRRFKGSIDRNTTSIELAEILTDKGVKAILEHEVFNEGLWDSLFARSIRTNPAFYRLIERLEQDMSVGNKMTWMDYCLMLTWRISSQRRLIYSATFTIYPMRKGK